MIRRLVLSILAAAAITGAQAQTAPAPAASSGPLFYYAGQPGRLTQDRDRLGGNPFASALVEVLQKKPATLSDFTAALAASNARHSGGWQQLQFPKALPRWKMDAGEKRVALVLINADYSKTPGVYSLPGAAFDAQRVPDALREAGFEVTLVLDKTTDQARKALEDFAETSATADASLIYIGGHGAQHKRVVYWMMGDYPEQDAKWLPTHAISVDEIGRAGHAKSVNLVLYASCRDDPFRP
jgi:Caspase domain